MRLSDELKTPPETEGFFVWGSTGGLELPGGAADLW